MTRLALIAATLLLAGCQSARYAPKGETDSFGYASERISDRRFSVTFHGDSATEFAQVWDFALLRAAELTREAGGTHFRVIAQRNLIKRDGTPQWTGPITGGNGITGSRDYPAIWLEVEIYTAAQPAPAGQANVFDAAETQAALMKRYRLGSRG